MNRLPSLKASKFQLSSPSHHDSYSVPTDSALSFSKFASRRIGHAASPHYALFAPLHYERNYAYPLVIWLHDDGGSERELRQLMPHISLRNYVAAAARGAKIDGAGATGYAWRHTPHGASEAAERVRQCIDVATGNFSVHAGRMFIAGYGGGGTMALRLALQFPEWFAGAVSLGGPMPSGNCPLGRVNTARRLPLLLASCSDSASYPQNQVMDDLRLLHSAGFALSLRRYLGEHELTTDMLADMDRWIMEQICSGTLSTASL